MHHSHRRRHTVISSEVAVRRRHRGLKVARADPRCRKGPRLGASAVEGPIGPPRWAQSVNQAGIGGGLAESRARAKRLGPLAARDLARTLTSV
jgi:hypothetical protein